MSEEAIAERLATAEEERRKTLERRQAQAARARAAKAEARSAAQAAAERTSRVRDRAIPAVALRLGVSEHQLRRACKKGEVQTFRYGGIDRVPPSEEQRLRRDLLAGADAESA